MKTPANAGEVLMGVVKDSLMHGNDSVLYETSPLAAAAREATGKYAHVPTSSNGFSARKHEDDERDGDKMKQERPCTEVLDELTGSLEVVKRALGAAACELLSTEADRWSVAERLIEVRDLIYPDGYPKVDCPCTETDSK